MGHTHDQHHRSLDGLINLFTRANHDLTIVQHRLEREFQTVYPDNANPSKLVSRIKKLLEDLSTLKDHCQQLLAAKQDLIDKAQTTIVGNRNLIRRMQSSVGIPLPSDSDDPTYASFTQIIDEWTAQVRSRQGDDSESEDINKLLFSAIVENR